MIKVTRMLHTKFWVHTCDYPASPSLMRVVNVITTWFKNVKILKKKISWGKFV